MSSQRISRDGMFLAMAHAVALRGTCNRLRVGAVLAMENRPISCGYNGAPSGAPHCDSSCNQNQPCCNTVHAEDNAIRWARSFMMGDPKGATLYITDAPCEACAQKIVEAGIVRVVYDRPYRLTKGIEFLKFFKVEVEQCHISADCVNSHTPQI